MSDGKQDDSTSTEAAAVSPLDANASSGAASDITAAGGSADQSRAYRRASRALLGMLLVGGVLMATHLGEFWPYSIYPMFSQAGRAWTRSIVRDVTGVDPAQRWEPATVQTLPGKPFALHPLGIPQNDLTKYVKLTKDWNEERVGGLRKVFGEHAEGRDLLVFKVSGDVDADGNASDVAVPLVWFGKDGLNEVNPEVASKGAEVALGQH